MDKVMRLATEKGVVIFSKSSCCLCYTVDILFQELGINPAVYETGQDHQGREIEQTLIGLGCNAPFPAVFIGGQLVGSTSEVVSRWSKCPNHFIVCSKRDCLCPCDAGRKINK